MTHDRRLMNPEFPRSNAYHPDWVIAHARAARPYGATHYLLVVWVIQKTNSREIASRN